MGKVGTCLVTLAGVLLAAGAQTFTGKEGAGHQPGRAAFPGPGPGRGESGASGAAGVRFGLFYSSVFLFLLLFFHPHPLAALTLENRCVDGV